MKSIRLSSLLSLSLLCTLPGCKRDHAAEEAHAPPAEAEAASAAIISSQARISLGLKVTPLEMTAYTLYEPLQAIAAMKPLQMQPLTAPVSGRIASVETVLGARVDAGETVVTLIRDPLPRVELTLTEEILKPASEDFHETGANLRKAMAELDIARQELKRLEALGQESDAAPLVPRQQLIDLRYSQTRAEKEVEVLRGRLQLHGLNTLEISALEEGRAVQPGALRWKVSLEINGLWSPRADQLISALPETVRALPWSYAGVGELQAAGLLSPELVTWLKATPEAGHHFIEIAGLLQQGSSLADVQDLYERGALEPRVQLRAPASAPDWDVSAILARPGERVEAGTPLLTLEDRRTLYLQAHPAGEEVALLRNSIQRDAVVQAHPLVADTGPDFSGLRIEHLQTEGEEGKLAAWVPVTNQVLQTRKDFRTWALQPGTRYVLEVPVKQIEKAWVLPADALVENGSEYVVLVENGDHFELRKVVLLHRDNRQVVLGMHSDLFPADPVVTHGAFALSLALQAGAGAAVDPHAGHNH